MHQLISAGSQPELVGPAGLGHEDGYHLGGERANRRLIRDPRDDESAPPDRSGGTRWVS